MKDANYFVIFINKLYLGILCEAVASLVPYVANKTYNTKMLKAGTDRIHYTIFNFNLKKMNIYCVREYVRKPLGPRNK